MIVVCALRMLKCKIEMKKVKKECDDDLEKFTFVYAPLLRRLCLYMIECLA